MGQGDADLSLFFCRNNSRIFNVSISEELKHQFTGKKPREGRSQKGFIICMRSNVCAHMEIAKYQCREGTFDVIHR